MAAFDPRFLLAIILRRLPLILLLVIGLSSAGIVLALLLPPIYRASAQILLEAPEIPASMARSTVPISGIEQMQIIQQKVLTRDHILAMVDKLQVYGLRRSELSAEDVVRNFRSRTQFQEDVQDARGAPGATTFTVAFDARDPQLAKRVVDEIVSYILDTNVRRRNDRAEITLDFFNQEVNRLGAELTTREGAILRFKNANKDALPDSLTFRRSQQASQQERLVSLEREESALRNRRNNLIQVQETSGEIVRDRPATVEEQMLLDLNRALSEQSTIFQENSPAILALKTRIKDVQDKIRARRDREAEGTEEHKVLSDLDLQLSDIDGRLKFIANERSGIEASLADLAVTIAATPGNETKLNAMERDRANLQSQYNTAVERLSEASTGQQIEVREKGERFTLLEPVALPEVPDRPNRKRVAIAGVLAGIALAAALVFLFESLGKAVRRPRDVTALLGVQPIATIPRIRLPGEARIEVLRRTSIAVVAAGVVPLLLVGVHYGYRPLGTIFETVMTRYDRTWTM